MLFGKNSRFWRRFRNNRPAFLSAAAFLVVLFVSSFANFIANDRPIVMSYKGELFFPVLFDYLPPEFGRPGFVTDYLSFEQTIGEDGWMIFPPIKHRPYEQNLNFETLPAPPGATSKLTTLDGEELPIYHLLGTDTGGRDLVTRLIYGCQTSLLMSIAITMLSLVLGVLLGAIMGYAGGALDLVAGRLLETIGYFPIIFMIIILVAFLESPSLSVVVVIFAIIGISPFAFYMRGQVLQTRKQTFVEAAEALGQRPFLIMLKHILPNSFSPILVLIPFTITSNIAFLATIDFLGFGVQPPTASLGAILRAGFDNIEGRWWLVASSSVVLVVILLLVNLMGDGVRDGLDPHATISRKDYRRAVRDSRRLAV